MICFVGGLGRGNRRRGHGPSIDFPSIGFTRGLEPEERFGHLDKGWQGIGAVGKCGGGGLTTVAFFFLFSFCFILMSSLHGCVSSHGRSNTHVPTSLLESA